MNYLKVMKIYSIDIKDEVHEFIYDYSDYVFRFSFNRELSLKIFNRFYEKIFSLKIFPNRFPMFNQKYRVFTIDKKFRVFYQVDDENKKVIINQIFSSYENYDERFFNI